MNFGYLIFVSPSSDHDYLKMAYALALSIKNTQKMGYDKVALVITDPSLIDSLNSPWVFDHVIQHDLRSGWHGRNYMDTLSPFEYTVCLDADMLFLRDYSHWIDYFVKNTEIFVANDCYNYRGSLITSNYYRKVFTENSLPNLYSMYTFFKKNSKKANEFFTLARWIINYPDEFKGKFLIKSAGVVIGTDESFALSANILDIAGEIAYKLEFLKVVHMKPMLQDWPWPVEKWSNHVGFYLKSDGGLKIGNYQQSGIVHYVEKDIITDELISMLEEIAWKKN
jgi:hypothetical protein